MTFAYSLCAVFQAMYCYFRSAFIKEKLGDPMAAITGYTVVLEMNDGYVLALKGTVAMHSRGWPDITALCMCHCTAKQN